jgi:ATP-dependent Lhr-like helicase
VTSDGFATLRTLVTPDLRRRSSKRTYQRGGRFVTAVGGEQYALPEAVERLRRLRDEAPSTNAEFGMRNAELRLPDAAATHSEFRTPNSALPYVILSAADPLNLVGIITPGPRIPAIGRAALALVDGRLVATYQSREVQFHAPLDPAQQAEIGRAIRISAAARMLPLAAEREQRRLQRWQRPASQAREEVRKLF